MKSLLICFLFSSSLSFTRAQTPEVIIEGVQSRLEKINDYEADAMLKTEIPFLKVPDAQVKIYYKKPDKILIRNEHGISLVPRESVSISLYSLLTNPHQALDAGTGAVRNIPVRVIKLIPSDEKSELVLATVYIDPKTLLVLKALITTRDNGTNELELFYGKKSAEGLPDKIIFSFNTRDFKLPKGVTFDYDDGSEKKKPAGKAKNEKGVLEITYLKYQVNKGILDTIFK